MDDSGKLVVARSYESDIAANIARGMLQSNGIPCTLNNEIIANVFAIPCADFDQVRLLVYKRDLEKALELLGPED